MSSPNPSLQILERGVIFAATDPQSPRRVACYPSLTRLADGRIVCVYRVGRTKSGADETVSLSVSCDEGQTWRTLDFDPETSLHGVAGSFSVGHLVETAPGQLMLICSWINRSNPELPISHPQTGGCLEMRVVKFLSADNGETWGQAEEITGFPFNQPEVSGPPIVLAEPGHLLLTMENQKDFDDPSPIDEKAYALISRDGGQTWPEWALIAHDFPHRKFWCNRGVRLPQSGRLAVVSWVFCEKTQRDLPLHLIWGSPDGMQWSEPVSTGIEGQISTLLALDDNTLLMATSHRESPASIRVRSSTDDGRTWDGDGLLVYDAEDHAALSGGDLAEYYQAMTGYTFGWSPMVRLKDGGVLLAYFAGHDDFIAIHSVRIQMGG